MQTPALPGLEPSGGAPVVRGRGRPKGSTNKRSADLVRYIEARYAGLTPGQVSAQLGLVTPKELKRAGGDPMQALAAKARELAKAIGCSTAEAWDLMRKERAELMPYVHQKRPLSIEGAGGAALIPLVLIGATPAMAGRAPIEGEFSEVEQNQRLNDARPE